MKLNFILEKYEETIDLKTKQPNGNFKWKHVGYFNFNQALKRYVTESIRDMDKATIQQVLDKLNQIDEHIERIVKKENVKLIVKEKYND
jgi:hypothetical protein